VTLIDRRHLFCGGCLTVVVWHWLTGGMCFVVDDWHLLCGIDWHEASVLWWMIDSYHVALIDRRHLKCAVWAFIHLVTSCLSALIIPHVCFRYFVVMLCCCTLIIALPQEGAEYCDKCLCLSLSVHTPQQPRVKTLQNFLYRLPVAVTDPSLTTVCFQFCEWRLFSHNGANTDTDFESLTYQIICYDSPGCITVLRMWGHSLLSLIARLQLCCIILALCITSLSFSALTLLVWLQEELITDHPGGRLLWMVLCTV